MRTQDYDIIHAGFGNRPATAAMLLSRLTGVPFTFTTHAFDLFVNFPYALEKVQSAAALFTISKYNQRYLSEHYGCSPDKVQVLRVPFNKKQCDQIPVAQRDAKLIVSVARLHPTKGFDVALDALQVVAKKHQGVRFAIVGNGPLEKQLRNKVEQSRLGRNVMFLGTMANDNALRLVSKAAVFLLPSAVASNGDRDGIPTALIEAMYLRTPVVSTRISGIPELVDDGVNGFLAESRDVATIADRVTRLIESEALRDAMGQRAREKVERGFYEDDSASILVRRWQAVMQPSTKALSA
jgi:glycosyltransferase involved in cell wall biosynthesis